MKKRLWLATLILISSSLFASERNDLLTFKSSYSVNKTEKRLVNILQNKGFKIFDSINHHKGAKSVGIDLPKTRLVIFGKPQIGSKLMLCAPSIAIDLPQKALIWKDAKKQVWLSMNNPMYLKERHQVKGCDPIFKKIENALMAISIKATK